MSRIVLLMVCLCSSLAWAQEAPVDAQKQRVEQSELSQVEIRENMLAYMRGDIERFDGVVDFSLMDEAEQDAFVAQMAESIAKAPTGWYQALLNRMTFVDRLNQLGLLPENVKIVASGAGYGILYYVP